MGLFNWILELRGLITLVENVVIAIISGIVAIVVATIGVSRKALNKSQETEELSSSQNTRLIETLNNTVEAQTKQIEILRGIVDQQRVQLEDKDREIYDLTLRVSNLERLTIEQALVIRDLEKSRNSVARKVRHEGGETQAHE